jgi:N-acetylneuraminate synthase
LTATAAPPPWVGGRVFIIAEAGSNWRAGTPERDLERAVALIDVAAAAGADAVKFQTYRAETLYASGAGESDYLAAAGIRAPIATILEDLEMPYEMLPRLAARCREKGVAFMSTPFSERDFDAVDPHVAVHKIASYELSHIRLLERAGRSGKPLVLSTGASSEDDVAWAVETFRSAGGRQLLLMQCTARYPAPADSLNLRAITRLSERFGVPVGLSDHSRDPVVGPVAAVALGARAIEKHFTLDNRLPGPDHAFAVTPPELALLVRGVRDAEAARGDGEKRVLEAEQELHRFARRGLHATRDIRRGEALREGENVAILRPGKQRPGLHPRHLPELEGRRARRDIACGEGIGRDDFVS